MSLLKELQEKTKCFLKIMMKSNRSGKEKNKRRKMMNKYMEIAKKLAYDNLFKNKQKVVEKN